MDHHHQRQHNQHNRNSLHSGIDDNGANSSGRNMLVPRAEVINVLKNLNVS